MELVELVNFGMKKRSSLLERAPALETTRRCSTRTEVPLSWSPAGTSFAWLDDGIFAYSEFASAYIQKTAFLFYENLIKKNFLNPDLKKRNFFYFKFSY